MSADLRGYAIVDCETDHLPPGQMPWEIAVIWKATDLDVWMEEVIHIIDFDEAMMTEQAAAINGFRQRWITERGVRLMTEHDARIHLERILAGKRIVGSKPSFDQDALVNMGVDEVWQHHYRDVVSMFLGAYGYEVHGQEGVCDALGIVNEAPHTALGDARAARDIFVHIMEWAWRNR